MSFFKKTRNWYFRFEREISLFFLVFGFIVDSITLKRIDSLWENIWIGGHIFLVGLFIVLINIKNGDASSGDSSNTHFWYVNILQFLFGGILSAFLVFYFRSTDIFKTWPFLIILLSVFIGNEFLKNYYVKLRFQVSLLFFFIFSFFIFIIPVILHKIGAGVFLLSGIISLLFISLFILILLFFARKKLKDNKKMLVLPILAIYFIINLLYFTNLIPPIPLSLKDSGVFHYIEKNKNGNYNVLFEDYGFNKYFKLYPDFNKTEGSPVYVYSAVFSPSKLNLNIIHEWQYRDNNKWITDMSIDLSLVGGRDDGFRTYSMRSNLSQGKWRVNIKTKQGQTIGHLRFNLIYSENEPVLRYDIKE